MKIQDTDSFNEKCDKVLRYLAEIAKSTTKVQPLTHLNKLHDDLGIELNDQVLGYLTRDKKFIYRPPNEPYIQISSLGLAFISHSSFVQDQLKIDNEGLLKWYDKENAKTEFEQFPFTRKLAIWAFVISVGLAILEIIKLLIGKN